MKYALVTGGSRGIGSAICKSLAQAGYPVLVNYKSNEAAARDTLQQIVENGGAGELLPFDVANGKAADAAISQWQDAHPDDYIAVLVNNAGICRDTLMVFMQDEQWEEVINTNLNAAFYITRRCLKDMLSKRFGRIINITSVSGLKGMPGQVNYSAAKAGLIGLTKALAQEVATRKVTVNAVAPGFIDTDMTQTLDPEQIKKLIPAGRFGKPEEVADVVAFLASEHASYMTGEVLPVRGGLL